MPELKTQGLSIGRDRFLDILRSRDLLVAKRKRRGPKTTYSKHEYAVAPNMIKSLEITRPAQVLVADITYVRINEEFAYLFLVTDACSRFIVGHHLATSLSHKGAITALERAVANLGSTKGVIHHTDRGGQYCCHGFISQIKKYEMISSMTDADHCAQNALAERMNGTLKDEYYIDMPFHSFKQAKVAIDQAVEIYNYERPHLAHDMEKPARVHFAAEHFKIVA